MLKLCEKSHEIGPKEGQCLLLAINRFEPTDSRSVEVLRLLLTEQYDGIDYMAVDRYKNSVIHLAIRSRIPDDLIKLLMDRIDTENRTRGDEMKTPYIQYNRSGKTALDVALATYASDSVVLDMLEDRGAFTRVPRDLSHDEHPEY